MAVSAIPELLNIITNPSHETNITGWARSNTTVVNVAPDRVQTWAYAGTWALRMQTAAATAGALGYILPSANFGYAFVEDDTWVLSVSIQKSTAALAVKLQLLWLTLVSGGSTISSVEVAATATTDEQRLIVIASVPNGATAVQPRIQVAADGVTGGTVLIDGWSFYKAPSWQGYVDGSQGLDYAWLGTAHASQSVRLARTLQTAVGRGGAIRVSQRLLKVTADGTPVDDITNQLVEANVDLDIDRVVSPFAIEGELRSADVLKPFSDYIEPYLILEYSDGRVVDEQLGRYSIVPSRRQDTYISSREGFSGRDITEQLNSSVFAEPFTVASGANIISTIYEILATEGITQGTYNIPYSRKFAVDAFTWGYDEVWSKLRIINAMLDAIGYYKLHTSRFGTPRAFPFIDLNASEPNKRYTTGIGGEVINEVVQEPDYAGIVNMVRVSNDKSGITPFTTVIQNNNLDSPVSIPNLGRTIFREINDTNIPDLTSAIAIARDTLQRGASIYNRVRIDTLADPGRDPYEIYEFDVSQVGGGSVLTGKWRCSGWKLGFTPGTARMAQTLGKVQPFE